MAKFGVKSVGNKVVEYPIFGLGGDVDPVLKVRPANDSNKAYRDAQLRRFPNQGRRSRAPDNVDLNKRIINADLDLYPKHVIVGWSGFIDTETNKEPEFTPANVRDLLVELEEAGLFTELRNFCSDLANFADETPDPEEVAGNSPAASNGS